MPELEGIPPPDENGATFEENASIKALYYSRFTSEFVLADDSGLEVDALHGAPGLYSARYAGAKSTDTANNQLLLNNLRDQRNRAARFVGVIALARTGRLVGTFCGSVEGMILTEPAGTGGFGYDPLFFYAPLARTFSQLSSDDKLSISHRGKALKQLFERLPAISVNNDVAEDL